jgi:hypothetical protein
VILVIPQKLVAFNGGNDADGTFLAWLGALDPAETSNFDRPGQGDFIG